MKTAKALRDAVQAANDFKYLLDIQRPGSVFHPSGKDARTTEAYAKAAELLAAAMKVSAGETAKGTSA